MKTLVRYASVYKEFIATNFSKSMSFRTHFVLMFILDLTYLTSSLLTVDFLFQHVSSIGVWNRAEFLFFVSFMLLLDFIRVSLVTESLWIFTREIRIGQLDFALLKPVGSLFTIFFRYIRPTGLLTVWIPFGCLIWFGSEAGLSLVQWLSLPLLILLSLILSVSIEILVSLSAFWTIESFGVNFIRIQLQSLQKWPEFVYLGAFRVLFMFVIPVLLIGSAPVRFLFDTQAWPLMCALIVAILVVGVVIRVVWGLGLRRYESASS